MNRKRFFSLIFITVLFLGHIRIAFSSENASGKDEAIVYIKEISSLVSKVDMTIRHVGMSVFPPNEGVKQMDEYLKQFKDIKCPEEFQALNTAILLSFRKIRLGLFLLEPKTRDSAVRLVKNGARLLKYSALNIKDIIEQKGLLK